jgi:transcriptional antiterminator NusG
MRRKKWYAIQTYAGSELTVKDNLTELVRLHGWEKEFEIFEIDDQEEIFIVPVEEVITSRSRHGAGTEYRVPYEYDLLINANERISRDDSIARKPPLHMVKDGKVEKIELFGRVIIEMTNRNEEEYLIPADKRIRSDIRVGEKIRHGVPLTANKDEQFIVTNTGKIVLRDKVNRVTFTFSDEKKKSISLLEKRMVPLKQGMELKQGDLLEREDVIAARASGLVKIKEYKDKRVVSILRIEKRRLIPGYIFARMRLEEKDMLELIAGVNGAIRYVGPHFRPTPIEDGPEMKLIQRKAGLLEVSAESTDPRIEIDFDVGEVVEIVEGPFADFTGTIKEIDKEAEEVTVLVKIFGRETPVKLELTGIEKL